LAEYLIRSVRTEHAHRHIFTVVALENPGVEGGRYAEPETLVLQEVITMMDGGDRFYTYSPSTQKIAYVHKDACRIDGCEIETLRSDPDAVEDNDLDHLPTF
jgi:hypothetical protein